MEPKKYWHGHLSRMDAEEMLETPGDFLCRQTTQGRKTVSVLSLSSNDGQPRHHEIHLTGDGMRTLNGRTRFPTIQDLISEHWTDGTPLKCGTILRRAIGGKEWELDYAEVHYDEESNVGEGHFGEVHKGHLDGHPGDVAVKVCNPDPVHRLNFLKEARIMRLCQHPNICPFIGASLLQLPLLMVVGLADQGNLQTFLLQNPVSIKQKYKFCLDAAKALEYISSKGIIHMDVAARNALVTQDTQDPGTFTLWMTDFGLSQEGGTYEVKDGDFFSQRWAAPEILEDDAEATTKSDVWSLGILIWEIFTDGRMKPYPEKDDEGAVTWLTVEPRRMEPSPDLPEQINSLTQMCWNFNQEDRPSFTYLVNMLQDIHNAL